MPKNMHKQKIPRLPDAELEVMQAVWRSEQPVSTSALNERLNECRPWNVSALQTLLNRLIARGFLSTEKRGKSRWYEALIRESDYLASENKSFLERLNSSSLTKFVATLYDSKGITESDLEELHRYIDERTRADNG